MNFIKTLKEIAKTPAYIIDCFIAVRNGNGGPEADLVVLLCVFTPSTLFLAIGLGQMMGTTWLLSRLVFTADRMAAYTGGFAPTLLDASLAIIASLSLVLWISFGSISIRKFFDGKSRAWFYATGAIFAAWLVSEKLLAFLVGV